jgi:penicillin-insensitive murein endopeptidase
MNIFSALLAFAISASPINPGDIKTPSSGTTNSYGSYASGCIAGAQILPADNPEYQITHLSRNRYYGSRELINFIGQLAHKVKLESGKSLLIGDLSQPRGGFMVDGHASHQNGLDVDIWFETADQQLPYAALDNYLAPNLVDENFSINPAFWSPRILQLASEMPEVERIFVSPPIKKKLCADYKGQQWLHKIRPWWNHKDHFHARLYCPKGDKGCVAQAPLPAGDGCDSSLDWWFSAEATQPQTRVKARTSSYKDFKIPKACQRIFAE